MVRVDNKNGMIFCSCGNEGIQIQYDKEVDLSYFSIWEFGMKDKKTTLRTKLLFIWQIIKTGTPYGDQIVLNRVGRLRMIDILQAQNEKEAKFITTSANTYGEINVE